MEAALEGVTPPPEQAEMYTEERTQLVSAFDEGAEAMSSEATVIDRAYLGPVEELDGVDAAGAQAEAEVELPDGSEDEYLPRREVPLTLVPPPADAAPAREPFFHDQGRAEPEPQPSEAPLDGDVLAGQGDCPAGAGERVGGQGGGSGAGAGGRAARGAGHRRQHGAGRVRQGSGAGDRAPADAGLPLRALLAGVGAGGGSGALGRSHPGGQPLGSAALRRAGGLDGAARASVRICASRAGWWRTRSSTRRCWARSSTAWARCGPARRTRCGCWTSSARCWSSPRATRG